jgi:hypothetical protein
MRSLLPVVTALVLGMVAGWWQPQGEVLRLREQVEQARRKVKENCGRGAAAGIGTILRAEPPRLDIEPGGRSGAEEPTAPPAPEAPDPGGVPAEEVAALSAGLDARRAQARAALVEQGDLEDDDVDAVDAAMDAMNRALKAQVEAMVRQALETGELDRREMLEFGAEALDIVLEADDAMREALPEDVYDELDPEVVDPFSYIDGSTVEGLAQLEGMTVQGE